MPQRVDSVNVFCSEAGTAPDKLNLAAAQLNSMKAHEFCTLVALDFLFVAVRMVLGDRDQQKSTKGSQGYACAQLFKQSPVGNSTLPPRPQPRSPGGHLDFWS